jgi:hypothetical protein
MKTSSSLERSAVVDAHIGRHIEIGQSALELAAQEEHLKVIRRYELGAESVVAARFLQKLEDVAERIYEVNERCLTYKGVSLFILHPNRLLKDYMPLEIFAAGEKNPVIEVSKCFYDPEYAGDIDRQEFDPSLSRAISKLEKIYS